jgi:beta-amylase
MSAFLKAMGAHVGTTICELQVGMGPCGELRYPSYLMSNGWQWPGVGIVMSHDAGMLKMLKASTKMSAPPEGLPEDQNAMPDDVPLFKAAAPGADCGSTGFRSGQGKLFLEWYSNALITHGKDVLTQAGAALKQAGITASGEDLCLSVKVSGLHWHVSHPSRATEACAGYNCCTSPSADAYCAIAEMLAAQSKTLNRPILFNFTCMEMTNDSNGGVPHSLSAPEDLIGQVRMACVKNHVPLAGENALEFDVADSDWAFNQMAKQIRSFSPGKDAMHGITLLRLGDGFVRPEALQELARFVTRI